MIKAFFLSISLFTTSLFAQYLSLGTVDFEACYKQSSVVNQFHEVMQNLKDLHLKQIGSMDKKVSSCLQKLEEIKQIDFIRAYFYQNYYQEERNFWNQQLEQANNQRKEEESYFLSTFGNKYATFNELFRELVHKAVENVAEAHQYDAIVDKNFCIYCKDSMIDVAEDVTPLVLIEMERIFSEEMINF